MNVGREKFEKENPYEKANIFSKFTFLWVVSYFRKESIFRSDLFGHSKKNTSKYIGDKLEDEWEKEVNKSLKQKVKPNLFSVLRNLFLKEYLIDSILHSLIYFLVKPVQAILLSLFIKTFSDQTGEMYKKQYVIGTALVISVIVNNLFHHFFPFKALQLSIKIRAAISSLIYRKILKVNRTVLGNYSLAQIVNILTNDLNVLDSFYLWSKFLVITPIQSMLVVILMWRDIKYAGLAGVCFIYSVIIPTQAITSKIMKKLKCKLTKCTDTRLKSVNEIISGIKVIKMYAWEKPFEKLIQNYRYEELSFTKNAFILNTCHYMFSFVTHKTAIYIVILSYIFTTNELKASSVFTSIQYLNLLYFTVIITLPRIATNLSEIKVSFKRIEDFLLEEEKITLQNSHNTGEIILSNFNFSWKPTCQILSIPSLRISHGQLCAIIGPVGSGKSTLLHALLNELENYGGQLQVNGSISYCSQNPWLFGSTVRHNILFGENYNECTYKEVVRICDLENDFGQFPSYDHSFVGEKGVILSGGQRARVNLARAVYKESDIYIMDDPLSAVDVHVGKHLFNECIVKYLNGKTRLLVTHQIQYLHAADLIVVLNKGLVEAIGTFQELLLKNIDFLKLLSVVKEEDDKMDVISKTLSTNSPTVEKKNIIKVNIVVDKKTNILMAAKYYIFSGGNLIFLTLLSLGFILSQAVYSFADYFSAFWTRQRKQENQVEFFSGKTNYNYVKYLRNVTDNPDFLKEEDTKYAIFYSIIIVFSLLISVTNLFMTRHFVTTASNNIHRDLFKCLMQAPMKFFSLYSSGDIFTAFSKDIGYVDQVFPTILVESLVSLLFLFGSMTLLVITDVYNIFITIPVLFLLFYLTKRFGKVFKQVQSLEGEAKSSILSHLTSTVLGLTTIRAATKQDVLISEFDELQDVHTSSDNLVKGCLYALAMWIDLLMGILIACITYSFIIVHQYVYAVDDTDVGLAMTQALHFLGIIQFGLRRTEDGIALMSRVEILLQYSLLEKEGPFKNETPVEKSWPAYGNIKFQNVCLKYNPDGNYVLKDLNCFVEAQEKVGIVGRTGAGKSSLISTLFRLTEFEGTILIDDLDIKKIGLTTLRDRLAIIPQEPVLFSDTVRYNLDPFREFTDSQIWNALKEVRMHSIPSLDCKVADSGSNFSLGEKQLLCLARAILRKCKILVMDEATASVDLQTDHLIKETIQKKFQNSTVLTIAHRLNTIMDYDKVMVLHCGEIVEFGHPYLLLKDSSTMFYSLALETGSSMMTILEKIAFDEYSKNN